MQSRNDQVSPSQELGEASADVDMQPTRQPMATGRGTSAGQDYLGSFSALKDSMALGHDLKKKRKALVEYNKTLDTLKEAYRDRVHIAQNIDSVLADQEHIIKATQGDIDRAAASREKIDKKISETNESLASLKHEQTVERRPYEEELERRNAELAAVKDELKQVKAQRESLNLFDGDSNSASVNEAAHDAVVDSVNVKYEAAKTAQREAQKALDAREKKERAQQKKVLDDIKRLNSEKENVNKRIDELNKRMMAAQERAAFCRHVVEHPEETHAMQERIIENEKTAAVMLAQINELASSHQQSKAASTKARAIVITAALVIVIFIIVFFLVTNR